MLRAANNLEAQPSNIESSFGFRANTSQVESKSWPFDRPAEESPLDGEGGPPDKPCRGAKKSGGPLGRRQFQDSAMFNT
jgi:hypothetical protein